MVLQHEYAEFVRGFLHRAEAMDPHGDPREHMRQAARAWREGHGDVINPVHTTTIGEVAPWIAAGLALIVFHQQIGNALGGLIHLPGAVKNAVASVGGGIAPSSTAASVASGCANPPDPFAGGVTGNAVYNFGPGGATWDCWPGPGEIRFSTDPGRYVPPDPGRRGVCPGDRSVGGGIQFNRWAHVVGGKSGASSPSGGWFKTTATLLGELLAAGMDPHEFPGGPLQDAENWVFSKYSQTTGASVSPCGAGR